VLVQASHTAVTATPIADRRPPLRMFSSLFFRFVSLIVDAHYKLGRIHF
jgi:hypothetical protein